MGSFIIKVSNEAGRDGSKPKVPRASSWRKWREFNKKPTKDEKQRAKERTARGGWSSI